LVHALGAAEFGVYSLVIAFASYFGLFDFGLTWAATRYFAEDLARGDDAALAGRFRTLQTFLLAVGLVCMAASSWIGPPLMRAVGAAADAHARIALVMGTVSFMLALQIQLLGALLRAAQQFVALGRAIALGSALLPLGTYIAVRLGQGLWGLLGVNISVNFVVLMACWLCGRRLLRSRKQASRFELAYLRQMMSFGGWSTLSRFIAVGMLQMDRLAVALAGQVSGLTYYVVPANLASRVNTLGGPAASLFFARASALYAGNDLKELARQHVKAVRFLLWVAVALAVPLIADGSAFLRVWLGPEMALQGGPVLLALTVGYFLSSIAAPHWIWLEATGHPDWTAKNMLFWAVPAIVGTAAGITRYRFFAVGLGVAGWQCGVALTNIVLSRRLGLDQSANEWLEALGTAALAMTLGYFLRVHITSVVTGLAAMCLVGLVALWAGFLAILSPAERLVLLAFAPPPLRSLGSFRIFRTV
jgi:O-antigen/teichoic acid export membrane protein